MPQMKPAPIVPTFQTSPAVARAPEPVILAAEEPRTLEPIVDPWVEEFEAAPTRPTAAAQDQGDLYMDGVAQAPREYDEPAYDDRDHRKSGWSLFGKKPRAQSAYAPVQQTSQRGQTQLRTTAQPAPEPQKTEDDLEIPSFLRRLAN